MRPSQSSRHPPCGSSTSSGGWEMAPRDQLGIPAVCNMAHSFVNDNGVCGCRKDPLGMVSPGLQLLETRLSNSRTLWSGQSCRILDRMYRSASGRPSLKKSPGVKTRRQEPIRDAGPVLHLPDSGVGRSPELQEQKEYCLWGENCIPSPKTYKPESLDPPACLPLGRATALMRFRMGRVSFPAAPTSTAAPWKFSLTSNSRPSCFCVTSFCGLGWL